MILILRFVLVSLYDFHPLLHLVTAGSTTVAIVAGATTAAAAATDYELLATKLRTTYCTHTYYLLPITYYFLPTAHGPLPTTTFDYYDYHNY